MANHAKVYTGKKLNPIEVNDIVQKLNKEKLYGVFDLKYDADSKNGYGKYQWVLSYKNDNQFSLIFWLSDDESYGEEKDGTYITYDKPKILSKQSCIEFRHGHTFSFMWWVEGVLRENLGKHYNAKMWDDGTGWLDEPPRADQFETFETYIRTLATKVEDVKLIKDHKLPDWQMENIPKELIDVLKLDFKV